MRNSNTLKVFGQVISNSKRFARQALAQSRNLLASGKERLADADRRIAATRYDKLAKTFLAGVQLACATILLK
jgi:transposase